jgi:hypothetical protein
MSSVWGSCTSATKHRCAKTARTGLPNNLMPFQHDYADSTQVVLLGMESATDKEVWQKARDEGFVIVTRDADMALTSQTNRINPRDQAVFSRFSWPPSRRQTGIFCYEFQTIGVCPQLALFAKRIDSEGVQQLSQRDDLAERVEAFVSRFGRLQDHLREELIPRFAALLGESPKSMLDGLAYAEKKCAGSIAPSCSTGPENCATCWPTSTWPIRCSSCKRSGQRARPQTGFFPPSAPWRLRPKPSGCATHSFSPFRRPPVIRRHQNNNYPMAQGSHCERSAAVHDPVFKTFCRLLSVKRP